MWSTIGRAWLSFLFASPVRTLIIVALAVAMLSPAVILTGVAHLINKVVHPLFQGLLPWMVVLAIVLFVKNKLRPAKKGKK